MGHGGRCGAGLHVSALGLQRACDPSARGSPHTPARPFPHAPPPPPRRHLWSGFRPYTAQVKQLLAERREETSKAEVKSAPPSLTDYDPAQDDAFATILQYLYSRLDDLGAHAPAPPADKEQR